MVDHTGRAMTVFLDTWLPEFKRSVEMFTGQPITLERAGKKEAGATIGSAELVLWQGQCFEPEKAGAVWVGTSLDTCTALTKTLAEDSTACESLYQELLEQSFEGAAQLLIIEAMSWLGTQPHSRRAALSSTERGQDSAIAWRTGSTS